MSLPLMIPARMWWRLFGINAHHHLYCICNTNAQIQFFNPDILEMKYGNSNCFSSVCYPFFSQTGKIYAIFPRFLWNAPLYCFILFFSGGGFTKMSCWSFTWLLYTCNTAYITVTFVLWFSNQCYITHLISSL